MTINPSYLIKRNLDVVQRRWKWLKFGQHIGTAGTIFCVGWLAVQMTAWSGVLSSVWLFYLLAGLFAWGAFLTFLIIAFVVIASQSKRAWLANSLEKGSPAMMDRVNALVYLEEDHRRYQLAPLKRKLEEQAAQVLEKEKPTNPFSPKKTLIHLGMFGLALAMVLLFQHRYDPFAKLLSDTHASPTKKTESPFELAPQKNVTETQEKKTWGEVRIVEPGHDVKLTKIDVLPLQIEMATSDPMQKPVWVVSINGQAEIPHELALVTDPNYAVYQPMIYLDELKVTEWDVVSYYSKVQTSGSAEYASKMFFIEIRPFREDLLKEMGAGAKGKMTHELLNEVTGLIKRQTEVLQQTHVHQQTAYANEELRLQDSKVLTDAEAELAVATNHLFGKIAAESENSAVGEMLDELTKAEQEMDHATEALRDDVVVEGKQREQDALMHLIACRKAFQKAIMQGVFGKDGGEGSSADSDDDPPVTADESKKALAQVSELRDRDKATLDSLHKLVQQQQGMKDTPSPGWNKAETDLKNNLHRLMHDNPDLFRGSEPEQAAVQENMTQALTETSSGEGSDARRYVERAGESMGDLEKVVSKNHEAQQMAQAYALKKIIDQNIKQLAQEQAKPGSMSDGDAQKVADTAEHSASTLKDVTDGMGQSGGFGPGLSQALSEENQQALHDSLSKFAQSPSGQRGGAAGTAQQGLEKISQAFDQSRPTVSQKISSHDQLQSSPGEGLDDASQELQNLLLAQAHKPLSPEDEAKAEAEIMHNLELGLTNQKDTDVKGSAKAALLVKAKDLLEKKTGLPVDTARLKKLLDSIEAVRIEANDPNAAKPPEAQTTFVDPSKLPPTYRDRIQNYYQQLSTHSQ